jgi:hypothetical protein
MCLSVPGPTSSVPPAGNTVRNDVSATTHAQEQQLLAGASSQSRTRIRHPSSPSPSAGIWWSYSYCRNTQYYPACRVPCYERDDTVSRRFTISSLRSPRVHLWCLFTRKERDLSSTLLQVLLDVPCSSQWTFPFVVMHCCEPTTQAELQEGTKGPATKRTNRPRKCRNCQSTQCAGVGCAYYHV